MSQLLVVNLLLICSICYSQAVVDSSWFSIDIPNLQDLHTQAAISNAVSNLGDTNLFSISKFIAPDTLKILQTQFLSLQDKVAWSKHHKTVYQDKGNESLPSSHPRNHKRLTQKGYIGRTDLSQIFIDIYNYIPLLQFLEQILMKRESYSGLYLSSDKEGSTYGQIYRDESVNGCHFDQHPFPCVWLLQKPLDQSGAFRYIKMDDGDIRNWNRLDKIFKDIADNNDDKILSHIANEGDLTCFIGNETLHGVDEIKGDRMRLSFVTAYSEFPNFERSHDVNEFNT